MSRGLARWMQAAPWRARQASEHLLHQVLARVGDGFLALDTNRCFTCVNAQAKALLACGGDERGLLGKHIWTVFPHLVGTPLYEAIERSINTHEPAMDVTHETRWGRSWQGRLYPSPEGVTLYCTDVTGHRRADDAWRLSETRYRLAAAAGHVWDWDTSSSDVNMPPAFWALFGLPPIPPQEAGQRLQALMHPDDLQQWKQVLRRHLTYGLPYEAVFRASADANADASEWRWFQTYGQAVWDSRGHATYLAGTTFEITDRVRAEQALRVSEAHRQLLFEQLADGVLLADSGRRILYANKQMQLMLGYSHEELQLLDAGDIGFAPAHAGEPGKGSQPGAGSALVQPLQLTRKDGSPLFVEVNVRLMDGQRMLAVVRDITARRAADQALETLRGELSLLAARLLTQERDTSRRLAQSLHDHVGQTLAVSRLHLDNCFIRHAPAMSVELKAQGQLISSLLDQAVREVRQVLADLRPPLLDEIGLVAALENDIFQRVAASTTAGLGTDLLLEADRAVMAMRWPAEVEYAAFMVAREAVSNAMLHAKATLIRVVLNGDAGHLRVDIIDDGQGMPLPMVRGRAGHLGIVGMRERCATIGASFSVALEPEGTCISLDWTAAAS
jgi:PAS domain S-box-containing protein